MRSVLFLLVALAFCGCGKLSVSVKSEGKSLILFTEIVSSPDHPFVKAESSRADRVLQISVTHIPSGMRTDDAVYLRLDTNMAWSKISSGIWLTSNGSLYRQADPTGVEVSLDFVTLNSTSKKGGDLETFVVPFDANMSGIKGDFKCEAEWKKG